MILERLPGGMYRLPTRGQLPAAWVQFVGSTATINSELGVTAVTRSGAGEYEVTVSVLEAGTESLAVVTGATSRYAAIVLLGNGTISIQTRTDAAALADSDNTHVLMFVKGA